MGSWGGCFVFDHQRLIREVIPAFRQGAGAPVIREAIDRWGRKGPGTRFEGLAEVAAACSEDMSTCALGRDFVVVDGVVRSLAEWAQSGRGGSDVWTHADFVRLFELVLSRRCISHFANFGRTYRSLRLLSWDIAAPDPTVDAAAELLELRSVYWAAGGRAGDGIHGWLDPRETRELEEALPRVCAERPWWEPDELEPEPPDWVVLANLEADAHDRDLARFRALTELAVQLGRGLLWGAGLRLLYDDVPFEPGEAPVRLDAP